MSSIHDMARMAELELVAKGYTDEAAVAAVSYALRWSIGIANKVSEDIRDRVAVELFEGQLKKCEVWARNYRNSMLTRGTSPL